MSMNKLYKYNPTSGFIYISFILLLKVAKMKIVNFEWSFSPFLCMDVWCEAKVSPSVSDKFCAPK